MHNDAADFASCCGPVSCHPLHGVSSLRFDAEISPDAGSQLPGTLASPGTGLAPAGHPELVARLHHPPPLRSEYARAAGRTSGSEHPPLGRTPQTSLLVGWSESPGHGLGGCSRFGVRVGLTWWGEGNGVITGVVVADRGGLRRVAGRGRISGHVGGGPGGGVQRRRFRVPVCRRGGVGRRIRRRCWPGCCWLSCSTGFLIGRRSGAPGLICRGKRRWVCRWSIGGSRMCAWWSSGPGWCGLGWRAGCTSG